MRSFDSIAGFMAHIRTIQARAGQIQARALREGGEVLQAEAKSYLGTYQEKVGPINAWEELAGVTKEERVSLGYTPNNPLLRSGTLRDHIELAYDQKQAVVGVPDLDVGDGTPANEFRNIGDVAIGLENGGHGPPRPFLSRAAFVRGEAAVAAVALVLTDAVASNAHKARNSAHEETIPF